MTDSPISTDTSEVRGQVSRRYFLSTLAALSLAALANTGCHSTGTTAGTGADSKAAGSGSSQPGVLRYPMETEPTTFDPALVQDAGTIDIIINIYEGLIGWNEKGEVTPLAAKELPKLSADGKTYTFTLRDNLKFHNGRAVTADDVRLLDHVRSLDAEGTRVPGRDGAI